MDVVGRRLETLAPQDLPVVRIDADGAALGGEPVGTGVFNSGLYAPNGISTTYSSAYATDVEAKITNIENRIGKIIFQKCKLVNLIL